MLSTSVVNTLDVRACLCVDLDSVALGDEGRDPDFAAGGSLYKVRPLAEGTTPLLIGRVEGHDPELMAWTFERADSGRTSYTSLGHIDDFDTPAFVQLLRNAVDWSTGGSTP